MKNILLIGVGGTGSNAVDILYSKMQEIGNLTKSEVNAIVFDTDVGSVETIKKAVPVSMADPASVGTICDRVGREYIREWFPCDDRAVRAQEMVRGASQWRKKSYLAFLNLMNKPQARSAFISALENMSKDPSATCEVYVIASIAGGTGSGSFIPIALYARRYLRKQLGKNPIVNAMVALPDIYASAQTEDNRIKIYANAYAILRELNAIYLVARNFNEGGRAALKSAPVKFRIGNPNEPNVGLLFDADDRQFWTPEAAPFTQIFVLDRIPGLSIQAHDIVLANSLYTLICTDIGVEFDSEASNHEILRSQNNGSNAIYASVSTSQMNFPVESVLDYLAHEKALKACEGEWLVLHRAVEKKMREKEQESEDAGHKYIAKDGEYAEMILEALRNEAEDNEGGVSELVERGTSVYDEDGKLTEDTTADLYFRKVDEAIEAKIPAPDLERLKADADELKTKEDVLRACDGIKEAINEYYRDCVGAIKRTASSLSEAIITFDADKDPFASNKLSLIEGLLQKDGKFVHPVTAMVQLCRLKSLLLQHQLNGKEWRELKQREIPLPNEERLSIDPEKVSSNYADSKSAYATASEEQQNRFYNFVINDGSDYLDSRKRTKCVADVAFIEADASYVAKKLMGDSVNQLKLLVYKRLSKNIDLLIEKYKTFFSRFEKEKENLIEDTKTALRKDSGLVDSVLNVYSSEKDKKRILDKVFKNVGPENENDLKVTDDLVGKGVFKSVYIAAAATKNDTEYDDRNVEAFRSLFGSMINGYKEFIKKSDAFKLIASYNIVEAMEASCEGSDRTRESVFSEYFTKMQSLATPPLKVDLRMELGDLVEPSNVIVYMMSKETGKYIKKHAEEFNLVLPQGQTKEDNVIKACASEFIRKYSGDESARVAIVKNVSDAVLYCTGEIMDITPLRIPKFNELSDESDNIYFQNYSKAIANFKKYNTDMWNPHIGNNLFQRGYLPYLNEKKEQLEDVKMVKALIYGLSEEKIVFKQGIGYNKEYSFRYENDGVRRIIRSDEGTLVTTDNIVHLINWLRKEDDIVDAWSDAFDVKLEFQKNNELHNVTTEAQVATLEAELTKSTFMSFFHTKLFRDKDHNRTLLELAYMLKTSEEASRDCDYADRILITCYDIFKDLIGFRANPDVVPDWFDRIYKQQLDNVFASLAKSWTIQAAGPACEELLKQIISWCESRNTFITQPISDDSGAPMIKFSLDNDAFKKTREAIKMVKEKATKTILAEEEREKERAMKEAALRAEAAAAEDTKGGKKK